MTLGETWGIFAAMNCRPHRAASSGTQYSSSSPKVAVIGNGSAPWTRFRCANSAGVMSECAVCAVCAVWPVWPVELRLAPSIISSYCELLRSCECIAAAESTPRKLQPSLSLHCSTHSLVAGEYSSRRSKREISPLRMPISAWLVDMSPRF